MKLGVATLSTQMRVLKVACVLEDRNNTLSCNSIDSDESDERISRSGCGDPAKMLQHYRIKITESWFLLQ